MPRSEVVSRPRGKLGLGCLEVQSMVLWRSAGRVGWGK